MLDGVYQAAGDARGARPALHIFPAISVPSAGRRTTKNAGQNASQAASEIASFLLGQ
jgi:hypothetical protein